MWITANKMAVSPWLGRNETKTRTALTYPHLSMAQGLTLHHIHHPQIQTLTNPLSIRRNKSQPAVHGLPTK